MEDVMKTKILSAIILIALTLCVLCSCGECKHNTYEDGACTECGEKCPHTNYENGSCKLCGITCSHSFKDGVCSVCGLACQHASYSDGICAACGAECQHTYTDSVCTTCGAECQHTYTDGVCSVCSFVCGHSVYEWGACTECGETCDNHQYIVGICINCYYIHEDHTYEDGVCTVCDRTCFHIYEQTVCTVCGVRCENHEYNEGICVNCGSEYVDVDYINNPSGIGRLSHLKDSSNILIVGNSFVGTSKVANILQEMMDINGKSFNVDGISIGMGRLTDFSENPTILSYIENKTYDVIFMCGLYAQYNVASIETVRRACDASGVELVIFPAHNENLDCINNAKASYPDVIFMDWKRELDNLISEREIDIWDLCINDTYKHSKPIAGYVGAHMIYRAIFGEIPTGEMSIYINQDEIDLILGDYIETGLV